MSKVICDVCGTTYPETASVCPICGCAKNTTEQTAAESNPGAEGTAYAPVKGGRFSKSNVRKRNKTAKESRRGSDEPGDGGVNKGLVAVVLILLLAIIAVLGYIGVRFLFPSEQPGPNQSTPSTTTQQGETTGGTGETQGPDDKACTDLKLSATEVELTEEGIVWMLSTQVEPKDTTDEMTFVSSDPKVATVDENGKITAVGGGEAVITVTCGEITAQCNVKCSFGDPVQPGTEPTDPPVNVPENFILKLRYSDITISKQYPDPVALFRDTDAVKATDITWTVDDPKVAAVSEKGVVSAVGKGNTTVHAQIGDQKASCRVIVTLDPENNAQAKYKISHRDVTLELGGNASFLLTLTTAEGVNVDVQWTASEDGYVEIDGKNIKAIKSTQDLASRSITVSATVEDVTYSCIVRITEKKTETT